MRTNTELHDRDLELRLRGHLYEIREINDEVIGGRQGYPMAETGYKQTLLDVADCGDAETLDDVADYIKEFIRNRGKRPANRKVRRKARSIVSKAGYPPTPYLNSA